MNFFQALLHHPRRLFLRRVVFQIHLWLGVLLSLYIALVSLTGAMLVYHNALTRSTLPAGLAPFDRGLTASLVAVEQGAHAAFPDAAIEYLNMPSPAMPVFELKMQRRDGRQFLVVADPQTGRFHVQPRNWVDVVYDFHTQLLLGSAHGMQWDGVGAIGLLVLAFTGILLWWRGVTSWWRALGFSFRTRWRRQVFDLHHVVGFWTLGLVSWWALSGVYFAWDKPFTAAVVAVSPLIGNQEPILRTPIPTLRIATLQSVLDEAQQAAPTGRLSTIVNPELRPDQGTYLYMNLRSPEDFWHADVIHVDAKSGAILSVWHFGENHSAGDWFLWAMQPLHFGTIWGPWVRAIWCFCGVLLAVLAVTGLVMYWNRYLRFRWRSLLTQQ